MIFSRFALLVALLLFVLPLDARAETVDTDIAIYGATPAGIAAAVAAAEKGNKVLLVEPTDRIGGLVTNGLSHTDFRSFEGLTGAFLDLTHRVQDYYQKKYGPDSPQANGNFRGTHAEPHVNLLLLQQMLAEHPSITLQRSHRLHSAEVTNNRITSTTFHGPEDASLKVTAKIFIDGSYEGDLMAAAGVPYRVGRESKKEYGESLAPEQADDQVQGYNFRLIMTREPENMAFPVKPKGYDREMFVPVIELLESGKVKSVYCTHTGGIYKVHDPALPNGKRDINDVSRGLVRLSLPNLSDAWPDGDAATRQEIFDAHVLHNAGLLYFLQNDAAVPAKFQEEARIWAWAKDEFPDSGHLPQQLYIREARRMVGAYVFTENDTDAAEGDARSVLRSDAIAMGDYGPNCHGTSHVGPTIGGRHAGEFYKGVSPYQIRYGSLTPQECENLLVPTAVSASHVGFCALRLEPIWMSLGQASGVAARIAVEEDLAVQQVPVDRVQRHLHLIGAATIYVSDIPADSPDFAAVQWWGQQGGLHGLTPAFSKPGQRGENILGQYFEAYPGHAVELDKPLDETTKKRWLELAKSRNLESNDLQNAKTRGDFIRTAFELVQ
ncbi:MAG: FAD-dependent oxidoreductase [Pirellulaceae bacterium]